MIPTDQDYESVLNTHLSPSGPITTVHLLRGRERPLDRIRQAVHTDGQSIFIFGARGVGKTSLALTAANAYHPEPSKPVYVTCDPRSTLGSLIQAAAEKLIGANHHAPTKTSEIKLKASFGFVEGEFSRNSNGAVDLREPTSINEAADLLVAAHEAWQRQNGSDEAAKPIIVIDEFERLESPADQKLCGDLVKQIGDRRIPVKVILCGIGTAVDSLLGGHESAHRYLAAVQLERLPVEALFEVLRGAADAVGANLRDEFVKRIAMISDGFPYYVHLLGAKVLRCWHDDEERTERVSTKEFNTAVDLAVEDCEARLRSLYDRATKKYTNVVYEVALWAAAAHQDLQRASRSIFDDFQRIMRSYRKGWVDGRSLEQQRKEFNQAMRYLKSERCGNVLTGTRQGWYGFSEPMLRGYCRLVASQRKVVLRPEYAL